MPVALLEWSMAGAVLLPLAGAVIAFLVPRHRPAIGLAAAAAYAADAGALAAGVVDRGALRLAVGGWEAPLGITLHADGLSAFMLVTTAAVGLGAMLYGMRYFRNGARGAQSFPPLALLLLSAVAALVLSGDAFNLYVTLELLGLSAAALVAAGGGRAALVGATRYLLTTFLASLLYLLGVGLLYHETATLDLRLLGAALDSTPAAWTALALMTGALAAKCALFPVHFWLPPAHSSATAPASALLSAVVVTAPLYVLLRLWLDVMPGGREALGTAVAVLGGCAVLWGSVQALRQDSLKLLVAYSTVAQVGYLFLPFALSSAAPAASAWRGALYLVLCHGLAKSAWFLAVGNIQTFGGDRISELDHVVQRLPVTMGAFAIAGVTLAGLPPTGGFVAKWLLLEGAVAQRQWWIVIVVLLGGLLASLYVFRVIGPAFTRGAHARPPHRVPTSMEWVAFALAAATVVLGFTAPALLGLLDAGDPFAGLAGRSP